jgi:hypothetical protein
MTRSWTLSSGKVVKPESLMWVAGGAEIAEGYVSLPASTGEPPKRLVA